MPELPEVETVCRTLDPLLRGKRVEGFELTWERTLSGMSPDQFRKLIVGRTIAGVTRRAKLIVIGLDEGSVISVHLRMTGELLYRQDSVDCIPPERQPYLRAAFRLSDGVTLMFFDVRKFGRVSYLPAAEISKLDDMFGPEPLAEQFTIEAFAALMRRHRRQIKPLLLDQRVIAGLGNIYVDESLFLAGIHPLSRADTIDLDRVARLYHAVRDVLTAAIERQGTTLRNYRIGTGESGSNQARLLVYGSRPGTPCPRCGTSLQRLVVGQRGSTFCPTCQPLITPDTPNQ